MQRGIISRIYGAYYDLRPLPELEPELPARLRGRLRLKSRTEKKSDLRPWAAGIRQRHLLIVGDHVRYSTGHGSASGRRDGPAAGAALIESLEERRNSIHRSTANELHALGANLDRALVLVSLHQPRPRWGFLDRFLASCHAGGVPAQIVFTKADLVPPGEQANLDRMIELYAAYARHAVTVLNLLDTDGQQAFAELRRSLATGLTLLAGQSGTGKSTLMNLLLGGKLQKTADVSDATGKGRHTTTNSRLMVSADRRMLLIDTPGVKEWGVQHLSRHEVFASFPELQDASVACRFADCAHESEQDGCEVQSLLTRSREHYKDYYARIDEIETDPEVAVPPGTPGFLHPERLRSLESMLDSLQYVPRLRTGDYIKDTGRVRTGRIKPH